VRAAENQGVKFSALYHSSRALSEQKQARATPLEDVNSNIESNKLADTNSNLNKDISSDEKNPLNCASNTV
jgi:hypothetical protein